MSSNTKKLIINKSLFGDSSVFIHTLAIVKELTIPTLVKIVVDILIDDNFFAARQGELDFILNRPSINTIIMNQR
jgi:hypothetical protein